MENPQEVFCPLCNRKLGEWDGRASFDQFYKCRECQKRIIFRVDKKTTEYKELPKRNCSSGMNFSL